MKASRDEFRNSIKQDFPEISEKADREYVRLWDDDIGCEYYSYSWFEALANAINKDMCKAVPADNHLSLLLQISSSFESGDKEVRKTIDVAFVENLFWQVKPESAAPYWQVMPENLKKLYIEFHHNEPL